MSSQIESDESFKEETVDKDSDDEEISEEDVMRILVATDIHLGYEQSTKRVQEDDSFRTFEEILKYAQEHEVDFILLAGDLFHDSKPSSAHMAKCLALLRKYCLGDNPVKIQFLTDPELIFGHCFHKTVNYEDSNYNVAIPVFSIHGNHDDPSHGSYGSLDVLSSAGLVNYFGKVTDVRNITVSPMLLQKGATTVAIYGLSYINDQRLSRVIRDNKLNLMQPTDIDSIFNIFVLHQNRARHSRNAYVPEDSLPEFLDLVIWGHEHECLIEPQGVPKKPYRISQPGSSVATSLAKGEAKEKHVGLLEIYKRKPQMTELKLKSVRPFVFKDFWINDHEEEILELKKKWKAKRRKGEKSVAENVMEYFIDNFIENTMIPEATEQLNGHPDQPAAPLLRLRVFYNDDETSSFEPLRLAPKYNTVVANPNDMILMKKFSTEKKSFKKTVEEFDDMTDVFNFSDVSRDWDLSVEAGIGEYFSDPNHSNALTVLSLTGLNTALQRFVNVNDFQAIQDLSKEQIKKTILKLLDKDLDTEEDIKDEIIKYRNERMAQQQEEDNATREFLQQRSVNPGDTSSDQDDSAMHVDHRDDSDVDEPIQAPTRGRGRGRGRAASSAPKTRGTRGTRARGRGKDKNQSLLDF